MYYVPHEVPLDVIKDLFCKAHAGLMEKFDPKKQSLQYCWSGQDYAWNGKTYWLELTVRIHPDSFYPYGIEVLADGYQFIEVRYDTSAGQAQFMHYPRNNGEKVMSYLGDKINQMYVFGHMQGLQLVKPR